ncbi:MAG TPA: copper oxidase [Thermoanaerobaculia bacterium]|nr:copper oxidase [Thermoanaerobaculia bacterium]
MPSLCFRIRLLHLLTTLSLFSLPTLTAAQTPDIPIPAGCSRMLYANVVALDQVFFWNRYGAVEPQGMIYALERDIVATSPSPGSGFEPGKVALRHSKRPRPLVLRMNVGDCLAIRFTNLLAHEPEDEEQPHTRAASIHVVGMQPVRTIRDNGANVGENGAAGNGVVAPGDSITYVLFGEREGGYLMHSMGAIAGGEGDGGSISAGLFGAINVEPRNSEWYRSQVTREELKAAFDTTPGPVPGTPKIKYDATYASGQPVLKMLHGNEIIYSDLTAVITGPNAGNFDSSYPYQTTPLYPDRNQPFREFTIIFHDEIGAVQAFPHFEDEILQFPLHSTRDAFAINYGTGGIGAEILANRLKVGPVHDCDECKYEEFFLSSWAVGDPAMVVDIPASKPCTIEQLREGRNCQPQQGRKATKAFFPDDPSNVYHSYLNEHVKFRNLHAGTDDHHVFHLHAHQWVHTPLSDKSAYLDSQTIGQGASFTYEIAYRGSGNRNRTVGDAIFHCHFYPHFAQGMWGLWRVHDVLELGTELDEEGKPKVGARALPDGEIGRGTPIPAVVPIPVLPMAPLPGQIALNDGQIDLNSWDGKHPGYPFFIPGRAGRRPPHPPLDTVHDGGLPRHVVLDGSAVSVETRHDFSKVVEKLEVDWLDEGGEPIERVAMEFHADPDGYPRPTPKGLTGGIFKVNGAPPQPGAPYADPCITENGSRLRMRYYKAADIQLDAILNKKGWHFPQQRITSLWKDVEAYVNPEPGSLPKAPEPFFIRAESGDCVEFWLSNLTPSEYHLDDFQVRTPTDILGQHIHLVKFDVTSSDGAANGFNYEDGSFAPEEVQERIDAIRAANGCSTTDFDPDKCPRAEPHPFFDHEHNADCDKHDDWLGAQTTVQRWWADPITTLHDGDRTIRTVFTHDHFGPSTHQQVGLYGGLVVEPEGSSWFHNETGAPLSIDNFPGLDHDGGPTSWQALIEGKNDKETYREFMVAFADFQLAYEPGGPRCPDWRPGGDGWASPALAVNPPGRKELPPPVLYEKPDICPINEDDPDGPILPNPEGIHPPCPELVSAEDPGMVAVNYRNEPVALRVRNPDTGKQAAGLAGDLSFAYANLDRADNELDVQPGFYPPLTFNLRPQDPFTPQFRVLEGDRVHVRILVGAHEEPHNFTINGLKWLAEPDYPNSGYRNSQGMGISEWFDFEVPRVPSLDDGDIADFLYRPSAATEWQWDGMWGLIRVYRAEAPVLTRASNNPDGRASITVDEQLKTFTQEEAVAQKIPGADKEPTNKPIRIVCPNDIDEARYRTYNITAVWAAEALQDDPIGVDGLVYNSRDSAVKIHHDDDDPPEPDERFGPLHDPTAILFVRNEDLDWVPSPIGPRPRVKQTVRREPLILRALAGECVRVNLHNAIHPTKYEDLPGWNAMPMIIERFNANDVVPSLHVGLHPQLVYYDIRRSDGMNVGLNPQYAVQTVAPGDTIPYFWYTGDYAPGTRPRAIEFGSTGLSSADPIKHSNKAAVGALIVEAPGTTWEENDLDSSGKITRASANIILDGKKTREFVLIFQDDVNQRYADGAPVENLEVGADPEGSGQKAVNYRTEPVWFRIGLAPDWPAEETREFELFDQVLTNDWIGGKDPETPVFEADRGDPVVFRAVHPGGHTQSHVFDLHGHIWEELPYFQNSERIGSNSESEWKGARGGHGPSNHFEAIPKHGAGSLFGVTGDYLYRDYPAWLLDGGIWGLFRVHP